MTVGIRVMLGCVVALVSSVSTGILTVEEEPERTRIRVRAAFEITDGIYSGATVDVTRLVARAAPSVLGRETRVWREFPVQVDIAGVMDSAECRADQDLARAVSSSVDSLNSLSPGLLEIRRGAVCSTDVFGPMEGRILVSRGHHGGGPEGVTRLTSSCTLPSGRQRCFPDWILSVSVTLQAPFETAIVQHELGHALGLAHTCMSSSVMLIVPTESESARCATALWISESGEVVLRREPSPFDAASLFIVRELAKAVAELRPRNLPVKWTVSDQNSGGV